MHQQCENLEEATVAVKHCKVFIVYRFNPIIHFPPESNKQNKNGNYVYNLDHKCICGEHAS